MIRFCYVRLPEMTRVRVSPLTSEKQAVVLTAYEEGHGTENYR